MGGGGGGGGLAWVWGKKKNDICKNFHKFLAIIFSENEKSMTNL